MQQDEVQAFGKLYDKYAPLLLGFISKAVCDKKLAEDLLQQVFIEIWNNRTVRDFFNDRLFTKMIITARRLCFEKARGENFRSRNAVHFRESETLPYKQNGAEEDLKTEKDLKETFDLIYYGGYGFSEASILLNIPVDILKEKMKMAIARLKVGATL
jgi:DNA-directed RNA polymerase specialized sigma24 family protein